ESRVEKKTASKEESSKGGGQKTAQKNGDDKLRQPGKNAMKKVHALLRLAWDKYQDAEGYVNIGAAGSYIKRARPDFDVRSYGFHKLPQLIEAFPDRYIFKTSKKGHVFYRCT
ncbi:MAG: OST-HTH/LOTUS domain-containing protein, partial [Schwartzia sp.]|nr:OST-HTH/LOTUS domain-containing protein [Schwartzia sp. (in: firmicutes)]